MSRDGKQQSFPMMNKLTRQLDKSSPFGRAGIAQAMTERVFPIERRGFVLLKSHTKLSCAKNRRERLCRIVRFVNCLLPGSGYNQTIDSNGAVGHLLTRSAVFVKMLSYFWVRHCGRPECRRKGKKNKIK